MAKKEKKSYNLSSKATGPSRKGKTKVKAKARGRKTLIPKQKSRSLQRKRARR